MLMLRCGLRVEEIAHLRLHDLDLAQGRILVYHMQRLRRLHQLRCQPSLLGYLKSRSSSKAKEVSLVCKRMFGETEISVRCIQKSAAAKINAAKTTS